MYCWPSADQRIVLPASAEAAGGASVTSEAGVGSNRRRSIVGASELTTVPLQSVILIFTGMVLPSLNTLGVPVALIGCRMPLSFHVSETLAVSESESPSSSVTVTVTV